MDKNVIENEDKKTDGVIKNFDGFDLSKYCDTSDENSSEAVFKKYEKLMENKTVFEYTFSLCSKRGTMYSYENGVNIRMSRMKKNTADIPYMVNSSTHDIGNKYSVIVKEVNRNENTVFLQQDTTPKPEREELLNALLEGIESGNYIRVPATIVGFSGCDRETGVSNNSIALINIANLDIIGEIRLAEWSNSFTKSFRNVAKVGQVVEVVVKKIHTWRSGKLFDCSRRMVLEADGFDPWKGIEQRVPLKTEVRVKCLAIEDRKFFGSIEGVKELNVYCEYPDDPDIIIEEGKEYIGQVYRVSEEKKLLRVRIREAI